MSPLRPNSAGRFRLLLAASVIGLWLGPAPLVGQNLPTGFVDELVVSGLSLPMALAPLPDGRMLVAEQFTGALKVVANGATGTLGAVPGLVGASGSRGLLGVAADGAWPARPYLYVVRSDLASQTTVLERYTVLGSLSDPASTNLTLGARYTVLTGISDSSVDHQAGCVRTAPDGSLLVSFGDDRLPCAPQDPSAPEGSLLRLDVSQLPAGAGGPPPLAQLVPVGNPLAGPGAWERLAWAKGLRNPFRFHVDAISGAVLVADVGDGLFEEIDLAPPGGRNFGWPIFEGPAMTGSGCGLLGTATSPVAVLDRSQFPGPASIVSLGFVRQSGGSFDFDVGYDGSFFYLDHFQGFVRRLVPSGGTYVPAPPVAGQPNSTDWANGFQGAVDGALGADGGLYYLRRASGELRVLHPDANGPRLSIVAGQGQVATAGRAVALPLVVKVTDALGSPLPNVAVTFTDTAGGGVVGPQPVLSDANGRAQTTFVMGVGPPNVRATLSAGASVSFALRWRGLVATLIAANTAYVGIQHSQPGVPLTLALEITGSTVPIPTVAGPIVTGILAPGPAFAAFDGLGLVGPPDPSVVTDPAFGLYEVILPYPPILSGYSVTFQAYAIDSTLLPRSLAYFVSNAGYLWLP